MIFYVFLSAYLSLTLFLSRLSTSGSLGGKANSKSSGGPFAICLDAKNLPEMTMDSGRKCVPEMMGGACDIFQ